MQVISIVLQLSLGILKFIGFSHIMLTFIYRRSQLFFQYSQGHVKLIDSYVIQFFYYKLIGSYFIQFVALSFNWIERKKIFRVEIIRTFPWVYVKRRGWKARSEPPTMTSMSLARHGLCLVLRYI